MSTMTASSSSSIGWRRWSRLKGISSLSSKNYHIRTDLFVLQKPSSTRWARRNSPPASSSRWCRSMWKLYRRTGYWCARGIHNHPNSRTREQILVCRCHRVRQPPCRLLQEDPFCYGGCWDPSKVCIASSSFCSQDSCLLYHRCYGNWLNCFSQQCWRKDCQTPASR